MKPRRSLRRSSIGFARVPATRSPKQLTVMEVAGQKLWDAAYFREHFPGAMLDDNRPGPRPAHHTLWEGDHGQVGWFILNYKSAWLPASLLR